MRELNAVHLNGLRAVEAAGRLGSLAAAAEELGVTVGAVSQQIIKTELQLGRTLFERTPKGLVATGAGEGLVLRLRGAFSEMAQAVAQVRRRDEDVLVISVAPVFAARWLVYRLDRFAACHPDIRLRIDATTRLVDLATSDVDIGIRVGAGHWPGVEAELLLTQTVFPVCSPAMAKNLKTPADILACPAVIDDRAMFTWDVWLNAVGLDGARMEARHIFNDASLCLDAAIAGQGVFLAWQTLSAYALSSGQLVAPFAERVPTGFGHYFVTATARKQSRAVGAFKQWVRDEIADIDLDNPLGSFRT